MSIAGRVRDAAVEATLAAALAGLAEGVQVAAGGRGVAIVPVVGAVAAAGLLVLAAFARASLAAIMGMPVVRGWLASLVSRGAPRTRAIWQAALLFATLATFSMIAFVVLERTHERYRFNDAGPIALASVVGTVGLVVILGFLAIAADRRFGGRLPAAFFDRRSAWLGAAAIAAIGALVGPVIVVNRAMPALSLGYATVPAILGAAVVAATALRIGRRRAARWTAPVLVVWIGGGTFLLAHSPDARVAILERGIASDPVAAAIRHLGDRDHDGYPGPAVGGSDCDDSDRRRSPGALDVPDNGIDENCTGADARRITFALRNQTRPVPPVQVRPNIVLISIDALRADHLGAYGYSRPTSPAIDALAASGVRFDHAYTSCPSTRCAIPSLLTGRYPSTLGTIASGAVPTLARVLRDGGYDTAAITCCDRFAQDRGALAGFSTLDATAEAVRMKRAGQSNADAVIDRALSWLGARDHTRPYFAWIHLYEPHFPYAAPSGPSFGDSDVDRYDAEIAFADAQIKRLLAALEPGAVVIVTSDHGEEMNEHGIRFHARSLYDQVIRVPLVVRMPGVAARAVPGPVSLVDVMPTLLDVAGIEGPAGMNGRTLTPALHGGATPARPVFVELAHDRTIKRDMAAAIDSTWKVIWDRQANAWSVYGVSDAGDTSEASGRVDLHALQQLLYDTLDRETGLLP